MMKMNNGIGKGIATIGIWIGIGIISFGVKGTLYAGEVLPTACISGAVATVLIWFFGGN